VLPALVVFLFVAALHIAPASAVQGAAEKGTDASETHLRPGYRLLRQGDLQGAMRAFERALELHPRLAAARTGMGMVLARQGMLKEAEQALREALVLNPDPVRTLYELGLVYERLEDPGRAAATFREGIEKYRQGQR
jgi:tetratricopeptide (TPR) repeat protein